MELQQDKLKLHTGFRKWKSSDLNHIDTLWSVMEDDVEDKQSSSVQILLHNIKDIWVTENIQDQCQSLAYVILHP